MGHVHSFPERWGRAHFDHSFIVTRYPFGMCGMQLPNFSCPSYSVIGEKPSVRLLHSRGRRTESQKWHSRTVRVEIILNPTWSVGGGR